MVGYGPEKSHFVIELTYNYGVKSYTLGNCLQFHLILLISTQLLIVHLQAMTLAASPLSPRIYYRVPPSLRILLPSRAIKVC